MVANGYTVNDEAGGQWWVMTCIGDLSAWNGGLHDIVMAILLGSGGLQVTVSGRIDPFPPWDSNLQPTHQRF
jgi:hypothetical protein